MRTIKALFGAIKLTAKMLVNQRVRVSFIHAFRYYYGVSLRERRLNRGK
jgi:hypothetical protein